MKQIQKMSFVGHYHFNSKDKQDMYYVVQCLYVEDDVSQGNKKGSLINIFVKKDIYENVSVLDIGTTLEVEVLPNLDTGKIFYNIVI